MQKDITKKKLQEHPDVFADIFNSLVFSGRECVNPSELTLIPTASRHSDAEGELRERTRDILMQDNRSGALYFLLGLENQDYIDNTMPLRCMGYDFAAYDMQVKEYMDANREKDNSAYLRKIHKEQKLAPVITLVTYYGQEEWDAPKDMYGMLNIPEEWKQEAVPFVHNYPMNFVHMGKLPPEVRERFTSDVRLLVEYLACKNDPEKIIKLAHKMSQTISHPEDLLDAFFTLTKDQRYNGIKDTIINKPKEEMTMCVMLDIFENRGIEKGKAEGRAEGKAEGRAEGKAEGKVEGKAEDIIELLEEYDTVPEWLKERIMKETDLDKLKILHKLSARVESIEEFIEKSNIK